jgi:hypothetical protein
MSLIARSLQTKAIPSLGLSQPAINPETTFRFVNGRLVTILDNKENYLKKGYDINDIIYSIVNLVMDKCRVAPWGMYRIVDEQAYKHYRALQRKSQWTGKDYADAAKWQRKALEPVVNGGKWAELIKYPNAKDDFQTYIANSIGYDLLIGNIYDWGRVLTGGANAGIPNDLNLLPAQIVDIWATDTFPSTVTKYTISLFPNKEFMPEEILHQARWNPAWDVNGVQLYGVSPLKAALGLTNRSNSSMEASAASFQNEGIKGVLHMKTKPGEVESELLMQEVTALKNTMATEWVGNKNRQRMGLSGYDMGWLPIGLSSEEMQLIESEKWDLRRLCNVWGVPSQLLNDDLRAYNGYVEANKALTLRCAVPALCKRKDAFNRKGHEGWGMPQGVILDFDMSVYSELQENVKDTVDWYSKLIVQIPNEQRELANLAAHEDEVFNEPWVMDGGTMVPYSQLGANEVDDSLNEDDEEGV